jgi:mxaA protein
VTTVQQPRPFGYVVGDLIEQRVLLEGGVRTVELTSLPKLGRVGAWLERRAPAVVSDPQGRAWLVVDYQLINAPQAITTINLPAWDVHLRTSNTALQVPAWPISIEPLTQRTVVGQGGLQELRADRPAPSIPTPPIVRSIELWAGALGLILALWLGWILWRNRLAAANQPFARAAREIRVAGEQSPRAWQAMHHAFDRTAGRVVQAATLPALFEAARHLDPLRPRIEAFFAQSQQFFFRAGAPEHPICVRELCGDLRRIEKRHER